MPDIAHWLMGRGVSEDVLLVLTFIPVLVTLTSFSRYVSGIKTFGIYASMILAFAYYYMGFIQGFTIVLVVVISSWITRNMLRKSSLHYLSRLAVVYSVNILFILAFIVATSYLPTDNVYFDFTNIAFLPLAMIVSVTDRFMSIYIKKDLMTAARLTGETLFVSIIGWNLMRWEPIREFFLSNLWIIPFIILVNVLIGRYSGFRWTEFIRFSNVLTHGETPDETTKK